MDKDFTACTEVFIQNCWNWRVNKCHFQFGLGSIVGGAWCPKSLDPGRVYKNGSEAKCGQDCCVEDGEKVDNRSRVAIIIGGRNNMERCD